MKKTLLLLFSLTISHTQELAGKVEYQTVHNDNKENALKTSTKNEDNSKDLSKAMEEAFKKAFQKKFLLSFTKSECLFEEVIELDKPKTNSDIVVSVSISGTGKRYINLAENYSLLEEDIYGEELIIKDSLINYNWVLSDETKKIGDYLCYKASRMVPVPKNDMQAYERYLNKIENGKSVLFPMEKPKPQTITAWYTTDIPANFGPNGESGLPGLILKLETQELIYLCSKISIKNNETLKIKKPNSGKIVTPAEFEKIEAKVRMQMENNDEIIIQSTKN